MARFYAQVFTVIFLIVTIGGVMIGDAGSVVGGNAGGNIGPVALHMTWVRDALDGVVLGLYVLVGFVVGRTPGKYMVIVVGAVLLALAAVGFAVGDDASASRGVLGMHFPAAVNAFDLIAGGLGVLAGLGTLADHEV